MLLKINPDNPQPRLIAQVVETLKNGGVIAYPTDTTYGIGCSILNRKALERVYRIKQRERNKPVSFICADLSEISRYAQVSNFAFKVMKRLLPGPYTFVLDAARSVPDLLMTRQKTVGIRVPDNAICRAIVRELGHPIVTTSANLSGEEPLGNPFLLYEELGGQLDLVVDGGVLSAEVSSVVSLVNDVPTVLRLGVGDVSLLE
jgi:tRNA threonylcarbamoyl adenosine modification protein (Sua5/YciO/YrdC/YwlC family)